MDLRLDNSTLLVDGVLVLSLSILHYICIDMAMMGTL